jgi:hypothetical protein
MRICLVSQEYPPETAKGEVGTQTYVKAHGLTRLGDEVHMLSRSAEGQSHRDDNGARLMRMPAPGEPAYTDIADWVIYSATVASEVTPLTHCCSQRSRRPGSSCMSWAS